MSEILDFCDFLSPTPEEDASRNAAVERVADVIRYIWPNCRVFLLSWLLPFLLISFCCMYNRHMLFVSFVALQVEVFGSYRTGLYLPSSDIDVCMLRTCFMLTIVVPLMIYFQLFLFNVL